MGGGRAEALSRLQESVAIGVPLLVVTGEEGSGKTTLCRMLEPKLAEEYIVVPFLHTVESFEDVVRIIARKLGIVTTAIIDGKGVREAIEKIVVLLLEERRHLLIIFDEAEVIYLATLERIRKMLDQMTEAGVLLHAIFFGRPSFLGNYEQLIICDFKQVEEVHLHLDPLSEEETAAYLENCIGRLPGDVQRDVFTEEVIAKICAAAKGNFGIVNALAEESIVAPGDNSSFMVLLDSVADETEEESGGFDWSKAIADTKRFVPLIPWVGGAVVLVVVMFLIFGSGDEVEKVAVLPPVKTQVSDPIVVTAVAPIEDVADVEVAAPVEAVTDVEVTAPIEDVVDVEIITFEEIVEVDKPHSGGPVSQPDIEKYEDGKPEVLPSEAEKPEVIQPEVKKAEAVVAKQVPSQENIIVELRPSKSLKKRVGALEPVTKKKLSVQAAKVNKVVPSNAHLTVDQLYARRIIAGKIWESGARDSMYTIQLMVLTSQNAEENLKQMLAQENYRKQASNFFIFNKHDSPAVLLVYYGEYDTIAEARRAQGSIPAFLQKHKPYALSVKGAVAKVRR